MPPRPKPRLLAKTLKAAASRQPLLTPLAEIAMSFADHSLPATPIAIRWQKCWQTKEPLLVAQINWRSRSGELPKWQKDYLYLDARQQSFGVTVQSKKPAGTTAQTALITTLRKQVPSGVVKGIWRENNGNIWLALSAAGEQFWLLLEKRRPPLISLMTADKTQLIRHGMKGTFTKRATFEAVTPAQQPELFTEVSGEIFSEAIAALASDEGSASEDSPDQEPGDQDQAEQQAGSGISAAQKQIRNRLKRKLKTIKKSKDKQQLSLPTVEAIQAMEHKASLLQTYGYLVKPGDFSLKLEQAVYGLDQDYELDIDPELSVGQNIEATFMELRKAKRSKQVGEKFLEKTLAEIDNLTRDIESLGQDSLSEGDLDGLCQRYKLPKLVLAKSGEQVTQPYKEYLSSTGHRILVGKGPKENDILTKNAKSHDFWLHAAGITGSHVVVPVDKAIKNQLPPALQQEAAMLALHFSKVREDYSGEVYLTKKQNVKKQKGMPPGLWKIEKSQTVYISYSQADIARLLARLKT